MSSLLELIRSALGEHRHRTMISGRFGEATGGEILGRIDGYMSALDASGCGVGSRLVVAARPSPDVFALLVAVSGIGATGILCDPRMGRDVVAAQLRTIQPTAILGEANLWRLNRFAPFVARRLSLELPMDGRRLSLGGSLGTGCPGLQPTSTRRVAPAPVDEERDGLIIFTSGTTTAPRGVVHTDRSLLAGVRVVQGLTHPEPGRIVAGSQLFVLLPALCSGAPVEFLRSDPRRAARQLMTCAPQATFLTPPVLRRVLATLAPGDALSGRVYTGSAPAPVDLLGAARRAGFEEAWDVYALTEAFPVAAAEYDEKRAFADEAGAETGDLVGAPLPGVEVMIAPDGELLVRGDNVVDRYLGSAPFDWLHTGDRAVLTAGRIALYGRLKDMFLVHAENIYPSLYEPRLYVDGVEDALLVGAGPDRSNQVPVVMVELAEGADERAVRRRLDSVVSGFGRARPVEVIVGTLPRRGRNQKFDRLAASSIADAALAARH